MSATAKGRSRSTRGGRKQIPTIPFNRLVPEGSVGARHALKVAQIKRKLEERDVKNIAGMTISAMLLNGVDERKIMNDIEELARPPPPPPPEPLVEQKSPMLLPPSQPLPTYTVPYSYMQPQHNWAYPGSAYVYPLSAYPFPRGPAPPAQLALPAQAAVPAEAAPPAQAALPAQLAPPAQVAVPAEAAPSAQAARPAQAAPPAQAPPPAQAAPPAQAPPPAGPQVEAAEAAANHPQDDKKNESLFMAFLAYKEKYLDKEVMENEAPKLETPKQQAPKKEAFPPLKKRRGGRRR